MPAISHAELEPWQGSLEMFPKTLPIQKESDYISHIQQEAQVGKPTLEYKIAYLKGTQW